MSAQNQLAVLFEGNGDFSKFEELAERLNVPIRQAREPNPEAFFLTWRDGELKLLDKELFKKGIRRRKVICTTINHFYVCKQK